MNRVLRLLIAGAFAVTFVAANAGAPAASPKQDCCDTSCPMPQSPMPQSGPSPRCCELLPAAEQAAVAPQVPMPAALCAVCVSLPIPRLAPERLDLVFSAAAPGLAAKGPCGLSPPEANA